MNYPHEQDGRKQFDGECPISGIRLVHGCLHLLKMALPESTRSQVISKNPIKNLAATLRRPCHRVPAPDLHCWVA